MKKSRFTEEQILSALKQGDAMCAARWDRRGDVLQLQEALWQQVRKLRKLRDENVRRMLRLYRRCVTSR
jgi:hypothetical protein